MPLLKMRCFFTFITCIVFTAGAVSDNGIVKVKEGEQISLFVRTSEMKTVSRLTVRGNGSQVVFRHCSGEEQSRGCKPIKSERFSLQIGNDNVSVTFLDANTSDEGVYDVEVIDDRNSRIHEKFTVALTGAVSDSERVEVESGENSTLRVETPGLGDVRRVTLRNCENRTGDPIIRYCSPEEEKSGCTAKKSERFSIKPDTGSLSVTLVDARVSDEGCYVVSYIDVGNIFKKKLFNVTVHDFPVKGKETLWKISQLTILAVGIAVLTAVVILVFNFVMSCIIKRRSNVILMLMMKTLLSTQTSIESASKTATDESLEMVDETKGSVANNNQRSKKDLNNGA